MSKVILTPNSAIATAKAADSASSSVAKGADCHEDSVITGFYTASLRRPLEQFRAKYAELFAKYVEEKNSAVKAALWDLMLPMTYLAWEDTAPNAVCGEGKVSMLENFLRGAAFSQQLYMGLISNVNYSTGPAASNTVANISTSTATNGWCEAVAGTCAARQAPSFAAATASGNNGTISLSSARTFSIVGTDTIKGVFLLCKSAAGTTPSATVGNNTSGAMYSAGLFTGGDKAVANLDTLSVSYTGNLT